MLRELIAWVLNNYLGKYVGNLNTAQLTVALLTGEVELENLPLRRDALRNLGLPLQALSGTVGKIKLQIPVRAFRTAPWCIHVENVYVVVGPVNLDEWDADVEAQADLDYKLSRLDALEAQWRAAREAALEGGYYASSYSGWLSYGTSLVTNICENLELKIRNVHVRYEDDALSVPSQRFCCGVTIDSLSARSCDESWQTGFKTAWAAGGASFKLVELDGMSLYWDGLRPAEACADVGSAELAAVMLRNRDVAQHRYLVSPVSAQAHLKRDRSETPLRTRSRPRLVCELLLNEVQLTLDDWQYDQMVACVRGLDDIAKYRRFRLLRPRHSVAQGPRAWWLYAARCHGYRRISAQRLLEIAADNRRYLAIYVKIIANPNETLPPDAHEHKERVEKERSYDELRSLREIAMARIPTPEGATAEANQGRSMLVQWFPQWWGWYNTAPPAGAAAAAPAAAGPNALPGTPPQTPAIGATAAAAGAIGSDPASKDQNQLEDELLNALAGSVENNSLLKRDAVFGKFTFTLNRGALDVCSGSPTDAAATRLMLKLQFENLTLNIESRPRSASHYVGLSLGSVFVKDHITNNAEFPDLIRPQQKDEPLLAAHSRLQRPASAPATSQSTPIGGVPLFQLHYERRPLAHNADYLLHIRSQSLDIVYNVDAIRWIVDFVMRPHQVQSTRRRLQAMKHKTKMEFIKNWEQMLDGDQLGTGGRQTWALEIDISAPQIIFAENFCLRNAAIVVCDFGRLQLTNGTGAMLSDPGGNNASQSQAQQQHQQQSSQQLADSRLVLARRDSEDEEAFLTPCSTPPGSEASESPTLCTALSGLSDTASQATAATATAADFLVVNTGDTALNERALHAKLYDTYNLNLTDMQVLVCRQRERWSFASAKGSSPLHVLDRFSISLQVERRVVLTHDPQYPSLTVSGSLPKLVAHVNEHKVAAMLQVLQTLSSGALQSPQKQSPGGGVTVSDGVAVVADDAPATPDTSTAAAAAATTSSAAAEEMANYARQRELSKVVMLQFVIDQMALEVQSRGRSIVELQVTGVKAGYTKRAEDTSLTLSVHGLLLVDAIQSFGPDFELLIASHRHVGMDSVSGSLKQSEPCSPNSPGSPDPMYDRRPTSPMTISKAISSLQRTNSADWSHGAGDVDALITVEVLFVAPDRETGEQLHIANIQFNNLDIIANQETIVELLGFARRVFPKRKVSTIGAGSASAAAHQQQPSSDGTGDNAEADALTAATNATNIRTEITFDFHRLNVLVLRALMRDQFLLGRKVGTFTMSEARIHATLGCAAITVEGSLGGLQVLDLTPEGIAHQRILSVGKDPLTEPPHIEPDLLSSLTQEIYAMGHASSSSASAQLGPNGSDGIAAAMEERQALSFRVSRTMNECVDVRIRMASVWYTHCARFMQELSWCATEFKHYLKNLARSIRDKATDMALGLVQLQRSELTTAFSTIQQTPKSFAFAATEPTSPRRRQRVTSICASAKTGAHSSIDIRLDIVLDTPVLVLPRSSCSPHVFVAHLGKITVTNVRKRSSSGSAKAHAESTCRTPVNTDAGAAAADGVDMKMFTIDEEECCGSVFSMDDVSTPTNGSDAVYMNHDFLKAFEDDPEIVKDDSMDLETYTIDVRNMNLFSLDTTSRKGFRISALPRAEEFYSCAADAVPVLHDTAIRLQIVRQHDRVDAMPDEGEILDVTGSVVKPLNLSLSRTQYEQLIETLENLFKVPADLIRPPTDASKADASLHVPDRSTTATATTTKEVQSKDDVDHTTFRLDESFKRRLFVTPGEDPTVAPAQLAAAAPASFMQPKVHFELPTFIVQLQSEQNTPLIEISFRDFEVRYERCTVHETSVQVSLRSLLMEDLLQAPDSKQRSMVVSSAPPPPPTVGPLAGGIRSTAMRFGSNAYSSRSCPDLVGLLVAGADCVSGSLPADLQTSHGFGAAGFGNNRSLCPDTPPPSPRRANNDGGSNDSNSNTNLQGAGESVAEAAATVVAAAASSASNLHAPQQQQQRTNLVLYTSVLVDPACPTFDTQYQSMRQRSNIDFNSLDLVVSVQSWFVLLNFFGLLADDNDDDDDDATSDANDTATSAARAAELAAAAANDDSEQQRHPGNTTLDISVRSLTLVFNRPDYELARANVSHAHFIVSKGGAVKAVEGKLGSISLLDLTEHGALYRERFLTTGNEALNFSYRQDLVRQRAAHQRSLAADAQLRIRMSSVRYVHTKRFVSEIQVFFKEFQLVQQPVLRKMKPSDSRSALKQRPMQLGLDIKAGSPIIVLPMCARSDRVLVADLGEFSLRNSFSMSDASGGASGRVISVMRDPDGPAEILDVMHVHLMNTDLFAGVRRTDLHEIRGTDAERQPAGAAGAMEMGSYAIQVQGANLLNAKCHLQLVVERNMDAWRTQNVPDFSVHGTLSRLEAVLDLQQYQLIRGFLAHNLGEPLDDLELPEAAYLTDSVASFLNEDIPNSAAAQQSATVWTNMSITLDLQDVSVRLHIAAPAGEAATTDATTTTAGTALACINFIKSSLKIDQFSDGSQDIDLVSQEILVTDSRFVAVLAAVAGAAKSPATPTVTNCYANILQPIRSQTDAADTVQAEVHSRRRRDISKYTILLNNMRMMAILDWLESVRDFLSQSADVPTDEHRQQQQPHAAAAFSENAAAFSTSASTAGGAEECLEVVLNITNSELVFVERPDKWDSNAVILKSTTIVSYRPADVEKVMSINLNHLEVFSCILGREDETALSIIDPVTVNLDLRRNTLDIQLQKRLCVRLSYHDLKMFIQMMESVPKQTRTAKTKQLQRGEDGRLAAEHAIQVEKLKSLGFAPVDCERALRLCQQRVDDAALWLTQNAEPSRSYLHHQHSLTAAQMPVNPLSVNAFCLRANYISLCVIDDCRDADVPLLEMSLSHLDITPENHHHGSPTATAAAAAAAPAANSGGGLFRAGTLKGTFASDYYNRALSGWEPLVEPWKCEASWSYSLGTAGMQRNRLHLRISSQDLLKLNVTSTIVELAQLVHSNWTQDYYSVGQTYRPRVPFVPFALRNDTGVRLCFSTIVSETGASGGPTALTRSSQDLRHQTDARWLAVEPGATQTFSFGAPTKQRHLDTHKSNFHQVLVRVEGWTEVGPVSVDRVGVYFRHARHQNDEYLLMPRTRIVFAVTLEGSAHKLVTVRSALQLHNRLRHRMLLKMEHFYGHLNVRVWPAAKTAVVPSQQTFSVPLTHVHSFLFLRPLPAEAEAPPAAVQSVAEAMRAAVGATAAATATGEASAVVKFNGNDYWNQFEGAGSFGGGAATGPSAASAFANTFQFCTKSVHWKEMEDGCDVHQELRTCKGNGIGTFRWVAAIKRDGYPASKDAAGIPGHSITLSAPLSLHNLLPCDLLYRLSGAAGTQGRIAPTESADVHDVDLEAHMEITLTLDGYPKPAPIQVPAGLMGAVETNLRLVDVKGRVLILRVGVVVVRGAGMQLSVSAPFWLVNRTGLPLVFRQEGVALESAGQFAEHEQARLVSPLMYSIADADASPAMTMRLGRRFGGSPPWCQPFSMHKDIIHRQLRSDVTNETFIIGIEVRRGRGRYSKTSVLTFSPRFQLYNRSSYKLQFSQKCFASTVLDPTAKATFIEAVPGCNLPFHWPRLDRLQELCIRLPEVEGCMWSGGIPIHETQSLYINIRNTNGDMHFLRVEIVLQGATYFLLFGDAQALPPPIRIDNYSDVPLKFHQYNCRHQWRTVVRPHTSMAYALDEPLGSAALCIEAPGGVSHNYSLCDLGMSANLTYENFIYIAFSGTFRTGTAGDPDGSGVDGIGGGSGAGGGGGSLVAVRHDSYDYDLESQQLVLSVCDGGRVVLARKQPGDRAQLWRMNKDKQLEHEGSSPPTEPGQRSAGGASAGSSTATASPLPRLVLDLERAPQPMKEIPLVVRAAHRQRRSTQTWHFTAEGRLMCEHSNLCVQARGGFFGLCEGSEAVLGMIVSDTHVITERLVPLEQAIERQKLRPGSGFLSVAVSMDGPIKTIQIKDIKSLTTSPIRLALDPTWHHVSHLLPHPRTQRRAIESRAMQSTNLNNNNNNNESEAAAAAADDGNTLGEYHINVRMARGVGVSLIAKRPREELCFCSLESIALEAVATPSVRSLDLSVGDLQIDNQLFETPCPVMLYTIRNAGDLAAAAAAAVPSTSASSMTSSAASSQLLACPTTTAELSAVQLNVKMLPSPNTNAVIVEHLVLSLRPLAVYLEERLILRLALFFGLGRALQDPAALPDESDYEAQRVATKILAANAKRYYFGDLQIVPSQIRLSVITASKLSAHLSEVKRQLGLTLIKFEDASIDFEKFTDRHHFETLEVYWRAITAHYKQELKWQAASILGSVDFLGNPSGLANDLQEGVSGLIFEGSVKSLVKNVTHGLSNSTAKLTESLSGGLGRVVLDAQDTETRQRILEMSSGASSTGEHLKAGLKGFGFGLLGGVTSIVKHTYVGAQTDGLQGFISGLGRGIVGTVTKPVIGVLDLASETASAVRETSKSAHRTLPERKRIPRCLSGAPNGLLPQYSQVQSKGQQHLFLINKRDFSEQFMAYEPCLLERRESKLRLLVSSENVWVFSRSEESTTIIFSYHLSELISCHPVTVNMAAEGHKTKKLQHYIELCLSLPPKSVNYTGTEVVKRPRVRCQTEEMSQRASRHINYAKSVYDEREHTLNSESVMDN